MHRRRIAPFYRFVYRAFYLLLDVDRLRELDGELRWFSHNRFNLLSFYDADHGARRVGALRPWAEGLLGEHGVSLAGGRIRLLCMPRLLGAAFNPLSLWYCEHRDGTLRAVIAEVRNTFGERHCYVLASGGRPLPYAGEHEKDKCFHVSPFFDLRGRYRFALAEPGAALRVAIHESRDGAPILDATLAGRRVALRDGALLGAALRTPLQAFKILAAIHWEALKLWLRGARYHRKPPPPLTESS